MKYPTLEEVETADIVQLCRWYRFLKSPGESAVGDKDYTKFLKEELKIMNNIILRQTKLGGMTSEISKQIGWE